MIKYIICGLIILVYLVMLGIIIYRIRAEEKLQRLEEAENV